MTEVITFSVGEAMPHREAVLRLQGIPSGACVPKRIECLCEAAFDLFAERAEPVGIIQEISTSDFATVFEGEGQNEAPTPVGDIFPRADDLALYVVSVGQPISQAIAEAFSTQDFALANMLDSVASAAADKLVEVIQHRFLENLSSRGQGTPTTKVQGYSPGYCGWHISGQRRLFQSLRPECIGVSLRDSYLMEPLKSVSGVLLAGPADVHDFAMSYPFCSECETHGCRDRLRALLAE